MDDLTVKIHCLCNGVICHASNADEVRTADEFAIGTLPRRDVADAFSFYAQSLGLISNQYMCYEEHVEEFRLALSQKHGGSVPGYFVISNPPYRKPEAGILCARVSSPSDADAAINQNARLLICTDPNNLSSTFKHVQSRSNRIPLFVEVDSLNQANPLLNVASVDGFVTATVPTSDDLKAALTAIVRKQSEWSQRSTTKCRVGVLAHQGDYKLHADHFLHAIEDRGLSENVEVVEVRTKDEVILVQGLLMPGGWSNLQSWMLKIDGIGEAIKSRVQAGMPLCAVCAGMILARRTDGKDCLGRIALGLIEMRIENNELDGRLTVTRTNRATGQETIEIHDFSNGPYAMDFPESEVEVLARVSGGPHDGKVVGLRQDNVSAFAFHEGIHGDFVGECVDFWRTTG